MNDRLDELIALAALGELTGEETTELDELLATDHAAADELADALGAAAALQSSDPLAPPPRLRAAVLASIASIEQVPVQDDRADPATVMPPIPLDDARRRRRMTTVLAAAAAVVLIAIGGLVVATRNEPSDDPIAAVLDADDVTTRSLAGSLGGTLEVAYSADENAMVVTGDDIPAVGADETYQLWLVDDSAQVSAGTFRPDASGRVAVRVDADPSGFVVGVTLEPSGGSEQPTLPILASA